MSGSEQEAQLTLKDRMNFPYLLANQVLTFQKTIQNLDFSEPQIQEAIKGFVHLIPKSWKDKEFNNALTKAKKEKQIDVRPLVAGRTRVSLQVCRELGIEAFKNKEIVDYYAVFQACMDLLDRRKMLSKIMRIEELDSIESLTEDDLRKGNLPSE